MSKILIITRDKADKVRGDLFHFQKYGEEMGYTSDFINLKNVSVIIENDQQPRFFNKEKEINFGEYKAVLFRTIGRLEHLAHLIAQRLSELNIHYTDKYIGSLGLLDKANQMYKLQSIGLKVPKTFVSINYNENLILQNFDFPFILKAIKSSRGRAVFLINNLEELREHQDLFTKHYIVQEFLPNLFDYRVTVAGNLCPVITKRTREDNQEFLNNACKGATETFFIPDIHNTEHNQMTKASVLASHFLLINNSGVDVVMHQNQPFIIEINKSPQLTTEKHHKIDEKTFAKAMITDLVLDR